MLKTHRRVKWLQMLGVDRDRLASTWIYGLPALVILGILVQIALTVGRHMSPHDTYLTDTSGSSRRLLSASNNATPDEHLVEWERCDFEKAHVPAAWVFSHIICILITFIAIAIVCDDFFVPSLEAISEKMHLSEDVAGATFMAAGSSAPELFTSVAGVAVGTDVGVGTIVGSAVFNILIIIALTAALAGQVLHLDWKPLVRDSFFYALSIACFIGFAWDGYFEHYEAVILLLLYTFYIVLMGFNPTLMTWMDSWRCCGKNSSVLPVDEEIGDTPEHGSQDGQVSTANHKMKDGTTQNANGVPVTKRPSLGPGGHARRLSLISQRSNSDLQDRHIFHHHQRGSIVGALSSTGTSKKPSASAHAANTIQEDIGEEDSQENNNGNSNEAVKFEPIVEEIDDSDKLDFKVKEEEEDVMQLCPCLPCCPAVRTRPPNSEKARTEGGLHWVKLILRWILFFPSFPFFCLFSWTIPDCSKPHLRKWYIASFVISVLWIAALSFCMVTLVGRMGCILNIDTYTMGLVIIAIGTSIPDALSSVLVARDGYGDMAVSNAIGSNVFDINLGLGLPFIIRIAVDSGQKIDLLDAAERNSEGDPIMPIVPHAKFGFVLLVVLFLAVSTFISARFRLTRAIGVIFVSIYVLVLIYAFVQELYCVQILTIYC